MTPKVEALAREAWQFADDNSQDGDGKHGHLYRDKLVELIVRECDNYVKKHFDSTEPWMRPGDLLDYFGIDTPSDLLKRLSQGLQQ